jgi:hypothetical protein
VAGRADSLRNAARAAYSPAYAYDFGLQVILDGFGTLIGDRNRRAP